MKNYLKYLLTVIIVSCNSDSEELEQNKDSRISFNANFENIKLSKGGIHELDTTSISYDDYFKNWTIDKGTYNIIIDSTQSIEGKYSLKIKPDNTSNSYAVPMIQTPVIQNIEPNSSYEVSFWLKGELSNPEVSSLYYYFLGGGSNSTINEIPSDWNKYSFTFLTGPILENLTLVFQPFLAKTTVENFNKPLGIDNTIWLDDITIKKID